MRRVKRDQTVLFHEIYKALKQPIHGIDWMLYHADVVREKLKSPEWNKYFQKQLKRETSKTRRIAKRQLKLFLYLTKHNHA